MPRLVKCSLEPMDCTTRSIFTGTRSKIQFANPMDVVVLESVAVLVMWEFFDADTYVGQYLGVWDIDMADLTEEDVAQLRYAKIPERIEPVMQLLAEHLVDVPYRVYFSGSKGLHVYVMDPNLFVHFKDVAKPKEDAYREYMEKKYSTALADILDCSPFVIGHGIRIYSRENPKSNIACVPLYNHLGFDIDAFWEMLNVIEAMPVHKTPASPIDSPGPRRPQPPIQLQIERVPRTPLCADVMTLLLQSMEKWQPGSTRDYQVTEKQFVVFPNSLYCPIAKRDHKNRTGYWRVYAGSHATLMCFGSCMRKKYTLALDAGQPPTTVPEEMQARVHRICTIDNAQDYVSVDNFVDGFTQTKMVFISSPMGSGKTYALNKYIEANFGETNHHVVALGTRRVQCHYFASTLGFTNYQDCPKGYLDGYKRLVLCVNSVNRLCRVRVENGEIFQDVPVLDLLIIDEVEEFLHTVCGRQLDSKKTPAAEVWKYVRLLVANAKRVVFMDGLPGPLTWRFFELMGYLPRLTCITWPRKTEKREFHFYENGYAFMNRYEEALLQAKEEGHAIAVICNTKKQMHGLVAMAPDDYDIICISGESDCTTKASAMDPDKNWSKAHILAYNSAVGPGPSFSEKGHFGAIFCYGVSTTIPPHALMQLLNRIRDKELSVHLYVEPREVSHVPDMQDILKSYAEKVMRFSSMRMSFTQAVVLHGPSERLDLVTDDDAGLARALVGGPARVQLRLESEKMFQLYAMVEVARLQNMDSVIYIDKLKTLVQATGGLIVQHRSATATRKHAAALRAKLKRTAIDGMLQGRFLDIVHDIAHEGLRKKVCTEIDPSDFATQAYFRWIRYTYTGAPTEELYANEFKGVQRGRFLPYMFLQSEVMPALRTIFDTLGVKIDATTGQMHGTFLHTACTEPVIVDALKVIARGYSEHSGIEVAVNLNADSPYKDIKKTMIDVFRIFGLRVCTNGEKPAKPSAANGKRTRIYTLMFDPDVIAWRNCIDRRNYLTGETFVTRREAFDFYSANKQSL